MIVAFSISPMSSLDATGSVTEAVAAAVRVVRESGLPNETNAMFTNLEGEWDEVMAVVKAVDAVAAVSPRVGLVLKADVRPGYDGQLAAKVERIESGAASVTEPFAEPGRVPEPRPDWRRGDLIGAVHHGGAMLALALVAVAVLRTVVVRNVERPTWAGSRSTWA